MTRIFQPNYRNVVDAAYNRSAQRLPLYEHGFDASVVEKIINQPVVPLLKGTYAEKVEAQRRIVACALQLGYDCIPFERCIVEIVQGGAGLLGHGEVLIESREDLDAFPWDTMAQRYIDAFKEDFEALREALPEGMKAVGGIGNGLFETMQDFIPFQEFVYLQADEPEVCERMWAHIGDVIVQLWSWLLENHADSFAVCRFGDDLGFRSSTLLNPDDIRRSIIPQYKRIVDLIHSYNKPFLLHSCGKIYDVMDDLINEVGIDAKHSNEDAIDTFDVWVDRYGDRIGNFGGIEMNIMTLATPDEVGLYVRALLEKIETIEGHGGVAIGTGNQISDYTLPENWIAMTNAVREWRGDFC
jgi:uroporphyrinogen decarboxylase